MTKDEELWQPGIDFMDQYDLEPDEHIDQEELLSRDVRFKGFVPEITYERFQQELSFVKLIPPVTDDCRKIFQMAKEIYLFGFFEWDLFTVANHYGLLTLEEATKRKYQEIGEDVSDKVRFSHAIENLEKKGLITEEVKHIFEAGRHMRNMLSHPDRLQILGGGPGFLEKAAYGINYLWDESG